MHKQALEYGGSDGDMFQSGYDSAINNERVFFEINDMYWSQGYCAGIHELEQRAKAKFVKNSKALREEYNERNGTNV